VKNNIIIDGLFDGDKDAFIDDGYSGAELDRPALNRLRQTVREGRVDVVLAMTRTDYPASSTTR